MAWRFICPDDLHLPFVQTEEQKTSPSKIKRKHSSGRRKRCVWFVITIYIRGKGLHITLLDITISEKNRSILNKSDFRNNCFLSSTLYILKCKYYNVLWETRNTLGMQELGVHVMCLVT